MMKIVSQFNQCLFNIVDVFTVTFVKIQQNKSIHFFKKKNAL